MQINVYDDIYNEMSNEIVDESQNNIYTELQNETIEYIDSDDCDIESLNINTSDIKFMFEYYHFLSNICSRRLHKPQCIKRVINIIKHTYDKIDYNSDPYTYVYDELNKLIDLYYEMTDYGDYIYYNVLDEYEKEIKRQHIKSRIEKLQNISLEEYVYNMRCIINSPIYNDVMWYVELETMGKIREEILYKIKKSHCEKSINEILNKYNPRKYIDEFIEKYNEVIHTSIKEPLRENLIKIYEMLKCYAKTMNILISLIYSFIEVLRNKSLCHILFPFIDCMIINYNLISEGFISGKRDLLILLQSMNLYVMRNSFNVLGMSIHRYTYMHLFILFKNINIDYLHRYVFDYMVHNEKYLKGTYFENVFDLYEYRKLMDEELYYNKEFIDKIITMMYNDICKDEHIINKILTCAPDNVLSEYIRNDDIGNYISYITQHNMNKNINIPLSVFDVVNYENIKRYYEYNICTNEVYISANKYAAYCGSYEIFKYTFNQNVFLNLMMNAIHGRNYEIIHFVEENCIRTISHKPVFDLLVSEALLDGYSEIAEYIKNMTP